MNVNSFAGKWIRYLVIPSLVLFTGIAILLLFKGYIAEEESPVLLITILNFYGLMVPIQLIRKKGESNLLPYILLTLMIFLLAVNVSKLVLGLSLSPYLLPGVVVDYTINRIWFDSIIIGSGIISLVIFWNLYKRQNFLQFLSKSNRKKVFLLLSGVFLVLFGLDNVVGLVDISKHRVFDTTITKYLTDVLYPTWTYFVYFSDTNAGNIHGYGIDRRLYERLPVGSKVRVTLLPPPVFFKYGDILKIQVLDLNK